MEVTDSFMPTAGVVGLLPMVTYFFLVVAMFAFIGNFVLSLAIQPSIRPEFRIVHSVTAVVAVVSAVSCYLTQTYYHDMLRELATVTDANDRQTLIRESYNAIGQFRYMDWFITSPLLLLQIIFGLNFQRNAVKRPLIYLLTATLLLYFASYIGHQQLSFDNEIQVGMKVIWGLVATIAYGFSLFTLRRLEQQFGEQTTLTQQRAYRQMAYRQMMVIIATCWGIYLLGYFLTVTPIDFSWIHIAFTITDLTAKISIGLIVYFTSTKSVENADS
ncbi:bacteriorhodopsin [Spirosoma validum]|uniref:Bacteriorhodopsin n=1 Tax=Spirosoma validum TaxID=2771355 RepID=A0A927GGI4_9BACT|nr:bacteriorhodopsin [Spirosoma validum]MBD2756911.1 bacteriorhodopsin [Spirosoma validum]